MKKLLLIFLLIPGIAAASCPSPKMLLQGEQAPCKGLFLSEQHELKLREEYVFNKELVIKLEEKGKLQENLLFIERERVEMKQDKIEKMERWEPWKNALYFAAGLLLGAGAMSIYDRR